MSEIQLHRDFLQSCVDGDLNHVLQMAYYHTDNIQKLLLGDVSYSSREKQFPGEFQPGEYIHAASMLGHYELVAQLINLGADPDMESRYGSPFKIACENGHLNVVRQLHTSGVDVCPESKEIWDSGIYVACQKGRLEIVRYILSSKPEIATHKTEGVPDGCILLYAACENGHIGIVKLMVEKGVDINALVFNRDGSLSIPLDAACMSGSYELVDYLLLQNIELPRTTIDQYPHMFQPTFESMMKRYKRPFSLRVADSVSAAQNSLCVYWHGKNLRGIHESWLGSHASMISSIDLHQNKLTELPSCFFELLPNLEDVDLSLNLLTTLPERGLNRTRLSRLIVSKNCLHTLPFTLFQNPFIATIDLYKNKLKYLPPEGKIEDFDSDDIDESLTVLWSCSNLRSLKLANNQIARLPKAIHGSSKLEKLNVSNNELISFVEPWNCPIDSLDLSANQLASFDNNIHVFWTKSLRRLSLAGNKVTAVPWSICRLENLAILDMSRNLIDRLPPANHWLMKSLNKLDLSHNLLSASCGPEGFADVEKSRVEVAILSGLEPSFISNCELPVDQLKNTLVTLDLSDNNLEMVPESVCMLTSLGELNISNNPRIRVLPPELGKIRNMWNLKLDNLSLQDLPHDLRGPGSTKKILAMLRAKLRKSVPFKRMKLMVVGLQGRGKTTLLATLQGRKPPSENVATVGISVDQWTLQPSTSQGTLARFFSSSSANVNQEIVFSTWDLAGQHVYYATHQCFLTCNTLYLVAWNIEHGQEGIEGLEPWLLNIQARAPKSQVIIVGTHLDKIQQGRRKERLFEWEREIFRRYDKKGFPWIGGNVFISNTTGEGLHRLKEAIHKVATKMQDFNLHEPVIGKKVPLSYVQLYDAVRKEADRRSALNEPPILTSDELLQIARSNPDNDIYDADELNQAAKFLHDHGVLLHYNDHLRGLNNLYFIDPSWLCDVIALMVTVREKNPFVKDGFIRPTDIQFVLKNPRLPVDFIPQYLQILERFEIALKLDDERILIPSMLPKQRPGLCGKLSGSNSTVRRSSSKESFLASVGSLKNRESLDGSIDYILRNYHLSYVPAGFWSRLIARMIISVHKWGIIVSDQKEDDENEAESKNYTMAYWREGILVVYEAGSFLIESFKDHYEKTFYGNEGVSIIVQSSYGDFSVMGFIVDQIDRLITEWYPGLDDMDEYGVMLIQRMIPCPYCATLLRNKEVAENCADVQQLSEISARLRNSEHVEQFPLTICALAAMSHDEFQCPKHPEEPISLAHMVPDLLLSDLPSSLELDKSKLDFEPNEESKLGTGGAGEVYKAVYDGIPIAIKRFHSVKNARKRSFDSKSVEENDLHAGTECKVFVPREQSISECLEDGKVIRSFWELRQEVAVLARLQHPCIVKLVGVCRIPLCFGLELAPRGGLFSVLENLQEERQRTILENSGSPPTFESILGRKLTFKIALQVAHALLYLHESEIVYRDLKSDNVLIWSLDENDVINVKLSDYGISCFATPQGILGEEGTPGFQAPEVSFGSAYDEKVDIFSFGVWLYELISGRRPFREHKTLSDIRKAVHNGVRPSLQNVNVNSEMPFIELLMQDCWVDQPQSRPTAAEVVGRMEAPQFLCYCNSFPATNQKPIEHVTCLISLDNGFPEFNLAFMQDEKTHVMPDAGDKLLLWCNSNKDRRFVIMDADSGTVHNDIPCFGQRVLCAAIVGQRIWLGTEGLQIEVFGRHCWQTPRILWSFGTKDAIMDFLVDCSGSGNPPSRVFASLANGTVVLFEHSPCSNSEYQNAVALDEGIDNALAIEKGEWRESVVINLANEGRPAKSMVFTKNRKEVWAASGNSIAIIDVETMQLVQQIKVFTLPRHMVTQLVTDGDRVWSIDRKSAVIYEWDVVTRKKQFKIDCEVSNNARGCILAQAISDRLFDEITDSPPMSPKNKKIEVIAEEEEKELEEENKQQDTVAKSRVSEDVRPVNLLKISPLLAKATRKVHLQPSILFSQKKRKLGKKLRTRHYETEAAKPLRSRAVAYSDASIRLGPILLIGDALWVGRSAGDILVINIRKPLSNAVKMSFDYAEKARNIQFVFGEVLCHLEDEHGQQPNLLKEITQLRRCGENRVVSALRVESKLERFRARLSTGGTLRRERSQETTVDDFKISIFEAWQQSHFDAFSHSLLALRSLEQ